MVMKMKLDWDVIRELLEKIETHDRFSEWESFSANQYSSTRDKALTEHCELLFESGFIEGRKLSTRDLTEIACQRLKLSGHVLLESMRSDTMWNKIKDIAKGLGVEGLKQIPALAIKLIMTGSV
jgi:hypothetical protein